ncbi:hypothetical protein chiPu_0014708 [Chiloscyllium punctatum]|uniref:Uncharacterized protein n=1 Tax=Chiloscyllium punctatum TaxID=137246 RepID=A0A401T0N9_CHIPU|nr:hypothetical protein [Chiloscyllium punctatum]
MRRAPQESRKGTHTQKQRNRIVCVSGTNSPKIKALFVPGGLTYERNQGVLDLINMALFLQGVKRGTKYLKVEGKDFKYLHGR